MTTTVTGKLNKAANKFDGQNGSTFFVEIGEQNYNFKTKAKEWTNYSAAIFAKDAQVQFYESSLVQGAIVSVSGTGLIVEDNPGYKPKLQLQDAKVAYVYSPQGQAPQQPQQQQYQQPPQQQQAPQANYQQIPQQQQPPQQFNNPNDPPF